MNSKSLSPEQIVLQMLRALHQLGYQHLRLYSSISPSGCHWRCLLHLKGQSADLGSKIDPSRAAFYGSSFGCEYFGWKDAADDSPAELAIKFVQRFPELCRRAQSKDAAYVCWFSKSLMLMGNKTVPVMNSDWNLHYDEAEDLVVATTKNGLYIPAPPGGVSGNYRYEQPAMWGPLKVVEGARIIGGESHTAYLPYIHRALNGWGNSNNAIPAAPCLEPLAQKASHSAVMASRAYWEGALYWMAYLFGWSRPVIGVHQLLKNIHNNSLPDDLLLAMFLRIWNNRGQLELLARWLYESDEPAQGIWPHRRYSRLSEKIEHVSPSQTWLANVETRRWPESYCQFPTPCYGGTNPLNLGITFVADTKPTAQPTISSCDGHFSTIVMQDLQGWYRVLCEYAKNEGRSVRTVQLFSAQHGQIATMRRSLESGLWFACRHEVHQWGH